MPKRTDIESVLIVGSGPIRIGQACEFDYSGAQACRVLRSEGYRVVLVNSNPATIMTDPEWADATYLEPLDAEAVGQVITRERPDALLPTLGGQTALNLAVELARAGVLEQYGVELIGADVEAISRAEDRSIFRETMIAVGLPVPESVIVTSLSQLDECPLPAVVRPAFTLGGQGGGLAGDRAELERRVKRGLRMSPVGQVLVERSLHGWQEFELEVMVDAAGNCVIVCSIENIDPMGVHTGDSWTVAPQQTLPDAEYQRLRDAAFACARAVGVATGGANVQFAYEPETRELVLIEMNPRVSRSSALASKATGFPIAKLAALLAVGYTLDELPNDITGKSSAAFEPALDYVAVKAPRFDWEKFDAEPVLGTEMRAVGEALGLGRTFPDAFLKALDGLEQESPDSRSSLMRTPTSGASSTPSARPRRLSPKTVTFRRRSGSGYPTRASHACSASPSTTYAHAAIAPAASRSTPAPPSSKRARRTSTSPSRPATRSNPRPDRRILILGSGPNRIGQGIEFDYCCVHAAQSFRRLGYEAVMLNSNPETVSTDYDTSSRLYLEPVTIERVLDVVAIEQPQAVVVTLGGQTPLKLARALADEGVPLAGDPLASIEAAEDRGAFGAVLAELGLLAPRWGTADTSAEAASSRPRDRHTGTRAPALRARRPRNAGDPRRRRARRSTSPFS